MRRSLALPVALAFASVLAPSLGAQTPLGPPTATVREDFGSIQTVRELADGRVLVADPLGKALYMVDFAAGTRTQVGELGQGPQEYRQPDAVWPLPGDSTLLVDLGNARLVAVGPGLQFGATMPLSAGDFQPGKPLVLRIPQGIDASGNIYFRSMGGGMAQGQLPDSAEVLRLSRGGGAPEVVTRFKVQERKVSHSGGANDQNTSIEPVPLSPEDAWGVAPDGSLAVARTGDYHVEWITPDGTVTRGPAVPYDALPIRTPEKEQYLTDLARSGGGIGVQVEIMNGRPSMSFQRGGGGMSQPREIDRYTWPEEMPAFYGGRIPIDRQGRAWVRRHVKAGSPSTYDIFDGSGKRVGTYTLDAGKRIIGFGKNSAYVVRFDDMDLSYLERYAVPAM